MYAFRAVEAKWQSAWQKEKVFEVKNVPHPKDKAAYILEMFPYPSGKIHVGHARNYVLGDVLARVHWALGYQVLHPIGWDAFGLPAENAAFKHKTHPHLWTYKNAAEMRENLKKMGFSYDWSREIFSCDPEYYRHEQKMFLAFLRGGLAYRKESFVNWDPVENTVLANEQVVAGRGWRSGAPVERKPLSQWFLKTTAFKESLIEDLKILEDWPEKVKLMQENWIGRSEGVRILFKLIIDKNSPRFLPDVLEVFTTRPDTLFGASFLGISPQHPFVLKLAETDSALDVFCKTALQKSTAAEDLEKSEKNGFKLPFAVKHPLTGEPIPLCVADYVMMDYGTGVVFACPAHDDRDFALAKKMDFPILPVVRPQKGKHDFSKAAYVGDGVIENSFFLNNMTVRQAKKAVIEKLESIKAGQKEVFWRLRDWGVSRQRYWGCPIPVIHCEKCGIQPVPEEDLPIMLPEDVSFDVPGNPLDHHATWKHTKCPACTGKAVRETDTFDTFFESSWYFLRFCSPHFDHAFDPKAVRRWMPVKHYIGGVEHAIMHLLYARFFMRALKQAGYDLDSEEPFQGLFNQGMIIHKTYKDSEGEWVYPEDVVEENGKFTSSLTGRAVVEGPAEKISKSKCNVISIDEMVSKVGADATRLFLLSDTPPEKDMEWTDDGIQGCWRYLARISRLADNHLPCLQNKESLKDFDHFQKGEGDDFELIKVFALTIARMKKYIHALQFNTYVAQLYMLLGVLSKINPEKIDGAALKTCWEAFVKLIAPVMPHLAEEIWQKLGHAPYVHQAHWPCFPLSLFEEKLLTLPVQIGGKKRGTVSVSKDSSAEEIQRLVLLKEFVKSALEGKKPRRVIVVPGRIVNVVP